MLFNQSITDIVRRNFDRTGKGGLRSVWDVRGVRKGLTIFNERMLMNMWHDDGEEWLAKAVFDRDASVTLFNTLYFGIDARATLAEADSLVTIATPVEPSTGGGYARQSIDTTTGASVWTASKVGDDWQAASPTKTFGPASGSAWTAVKNLFLTDQITNQTGKYLICSVALSTTRTLQVGDSLQVSMVIPFKEAV